jgi:hypothetical protein
VITAVPAPTPVTIPVPEPTTAIVGDPELHTPPVGDPVRFIFDPTQTDVGPVIVGVRLTVTVIVAKHPVDSV